MGCRHIEEQGSAFGSLQYAHWSEF